MSSSEHRVAYVCKRYPRFSETFIVTELLARQATGEDLRVVSLRRPDEGRFHAELAEVRAPVTYLDDGGTPGSRDLWARLRAHPPGPARDLLVEADVRDAAQALELADLVAREGITHLHAHFGSVATTVARLAARLTGTTYSFTAHAKDIFHEAVAPDDLRAKLRDAHHVVTVSDYNRHHLRDRFGRDADGVARVYNGLRLERFPFAPPTDRDLDVVAVGRLVEKKGFETLVDACALARRSGRTLRVAVIGAGEREPLLRRRIASRGVEDLVTLRGPLPQDEVRAALSSARALAAPCVVGADGNADGLPTVLLEAMALGTPVVSTGVTGIPEAVLDGTTGLLVGQHDAQGLADALVRLQDDRGLRTALAGAARRLVEDRFCATRQAEELRALLPADAPAGAVA